MRPGDNAPAPGFGARIANGALYAMQGDPRAFFPPGFPLLPLAPNEAKPRQWDYPFYYNIQIMPRAYEAVTFAFLRDIADTYDLLRAAIERVKNKVAAQELDFVPKDKEQKRKTGIGVGAKNSLPPQMQARIQELRDFFKKPDAEHTFPQWLRMLLEDILVVDAPCLYVEKRNNGKPFAFVPIDGATIARKLDYHGRTPIPPEVAFQQVIKGLPALDFTSDELSYMPFNVRTGRAYGYSNVEQVIITVDIALRRQLYQRAYYSEGANPNVPVSFPESWTKAQVSQFADYWDAMMAGNTRNRWRVFPLPAGAALAKPQMYTLKDDYDDWLARIICFVMGISPTPLIKQMNRATSQQHSEDSDAEGLAPILGHLKEWFNALIVNGWGYTDIEAEWAAPDNPNQLERAQADHLYVTDGVMTPNEVRDRSLGLGPIDGGDVPMKKQLPPAPNGGKPSGNQPPPQKPGASPTSPATGNLAKSSEADRQRREREAAALTDSRVAISRSNPEFEAQTLALKNRLRRAFTDKTAFLSRRVVDAVGASRSNSKGKPDKAATLLAEAHAQRELEHWLAAGWEGEYPPIQESLRASALSTVRNFKGATDDDLKAALAIADERAAQIVGMKYNRTKRHLETNPTPDWDIGDDVRGAAKKAVTLAAKEGWTQERLQAELIAVGLYNDARAETIARTEVARVTGEVAHQTAKAKGMTVKQNVTSGGPNVCAICLADEAAGWIPIDQPFPSGVMSGLKHPNCECFVEYDTGAKQVPV